MTSTIPASLPLVEAEFRLTYGSRGVVLDRVIPDTGADASILPWVDCLTLQLSPAMGAQGLISGVAGGSAATLAFQLWVHIDGQDIPCRLLADFAGGERIIGRDVLNRLEILFRGPPGVGLSIHEDTRLGRANGKGRGGIARGCGGVESAAAAKIAEGDGAVKGFYEDRSNHDEWGIERKVLHCDGKSLR
jgi:hypothetical protein